MTQLSRARLSRSTVVVAESHAADLAGACRWPEWAVPQVLAAADVAERACHGGPHPVLATELYRHWFSPVAADEVVIRQSLAGSYRWAHAGSGTRIAAADGTPCVVDRQDAIGRDGWWRTWNHAWLPTRSRVRSTRVFLSPDATRLADFVHIATGYLRTQSDPWLLSLATDPRRLARIAPATLYVPAGSAPPAGMLDDLAPLLRPDTPPLCRVVRAGVATAQIPGNGMGFGEHRSHLLALALGNAAGRRVPLAAAAEVFGAHGVDPLHPHR
jgi:hypothetical protein